MKIYPTTIVWLGNKMLTFAKHAMMNLLHGTACNPLTLLSEHLFGRG